MSPNDIVLTPRGVRFRGAHYPSTIGRGGIAQLKCEGDGATPAGHHKITGMLYRADRIVRPVLWARPIGPRDLWSDGAEDPAYNHLVRAPHGFSHERLRRADPLYDVILLTDWNWPNAIAGRGSAIFLHQWRRPGYPTEGCIAMSRAHIQTIAAQVSPGTKIIVSRYSG
ncbi:MAG: L,D-transpeptidase [Sedimentitalea sp.]